MKIKKIYHLIMLIVLLSPFFPIRIIVAQDESPIESGEGLAVGESVEAAEDKNNQSELPPYVPPPNFARNKEQMPEFLLKNKEEGTVITGFPAIGWDPDTGFNFGAALQIYNNGKKDSPFFRITPYRQALEVMATYSTANNLEITANYDSLYVKDSPWRVRSKLGLLNNPYKNYFGIGNSSLLLTFPGTGQVYNSYDAYKDALKRKVAGQTNERYDNYKYTRVGLEGSAEYDLLGGWLRPLIGFQLAHIWVGDYTGKTVGGATQLPTHLSVDCASGTALGCNGGWDIFAKMGLVFDTRNFEPNPGKGVMLELTSELSPKFLGSSFYYGRLNADLRAFGKIFDYKKHRLTLAGRFLYEWQFGDVPFYSMNTLAFTDRDTTGLGGFKTIRGYRLDRFIGPVVMLTNVELRYLFAELTIWKQNLRIGVKPFIDAGRVFSRVKDTSFRDWKLGGGGGLMLVWNLATVINFDAAWCGEGNAFYMEVGAQF